MEDFGKAYNPKGAASIVINVKTGEILAMASYPSSTFKMVMGLAALTEGKTTISERIYDSGIYPKAHKPKCWIYGVSGGGHRMAKCNKCIKKFM